MAGRIRTQKKIFTPTTNTPEPEAFLCQIIETGEHVIVHRSSIKRIYDDTAEVMVRGRRTEAKIDFRGSRGECRRVWETREEVRNLNDFDEPNRSENEECEDDDTEIEILSCLSNSKVPTKSHTPQQKRDLLASTIEIENCPSTSHSAKRIKRIDFGKQADDIVTDNHTSNNEDNDHQCLTSASESSLVKHMNTQFDAIRKENQQQFTQLSKKIDQKRYIDSNDLSSFRTPGCNHLPAEPVMYEQVNLLHIRGKNIGHYARQIMQIIFTHDELVNSVLPPGGSQYTREPLDKEKFDTFNAAMRNKYRIDEHLYDDFFTKLVRPKLVDFLCDERKRKRKSQSKNSSSTSSHDLNTQ